MNRITLQFSPRFLAAVHPLLVDLCKALQLRTARDFNLPEDDPVLSGAWFDGLLEALGADCRELLGLLDKALAAEGRLSVTAETADAVMRAASAMRLHLRATRLVDIDDESLETGAVDFERLKPEARDAFAAYVFLAGLQESLISGMQTD